MKAILARLASYYPFFDQATTDFTYVRLHGSEAMYAGSYTDPELDHWAGRVRAWAKAGAVFVYIDNDQKTHAPFDARRLMDRLGVQGGLRKPETDESGVGANLELILGGSHTSGATKLLTVLPCVPIV